MIIFAALLWSMAGLFIKYIPWHPLAIASLRSGLSSLVFLAAYRGRLFRRPNRITLLSGLALMLTQTLFVVANKLTTAANAIMLQYAAPFFVVVLGAIIYHHRPSRREVTALLIAGGGIVLFFLDDLSPGSQAGNGLALFTGLTFSFVFLLNSRTECDTPVALFIGQAASFLLGLPFVCGIRDWRPLPILAIVILGLFQLGLAYLLFGIGIQTTPPLAASLLAMIEPIVNPLWVFLVLGELPGLPAAIGAVIVLAAVIYQNSGQIRTGRTAAEPPTTP